MTAWSVAIYLGIVLAGCSVVSVADSFAAPEISTRLTISNAKFVFTYDHQNRARKKLPLFEKVTTATEIPAIVLNADETLSCTLRPQDIAWSDFLAAETEFDCVDCASNDTINILFSSGTTGDPKAIPWNHTTPIKCAIDGYCHQNIHPGDVCAWPTNLGWMMGPWLIFASLMNKATIALYEDAPSGVEFGKFIQEAKVTMLGVVPTIVKAWEASGCMNDLDWSTIKCFSSTGESSQANTMIFLSSLANIKPVIEYCGGTEIGGGYVSSVDVLPNVPAAFNSPAVGLDFLLIDPVDHSLSEQGEVFLIPPSIGLSDRLINRDHFETYYANTPSLPSTSQLRRHGDYFRRFLTAQGPVFEAGGRADDTMNLGGIKISSAEIERVLNQVEPVTESAAVSHSPTTGPDQLIIFAVLDHETDVEQLQKEMNLALKTELNPLFKVHSVIQVTAMPRTASGKVMRRKLRDQIA
jgi:acetyl-CoA synthetase